MQSPAEIRERIRQARRQLSTESCHRAGRLISQRLAALPAFKEPRDVACFLSIDGEVDTRPILHTCWSMDKRVWLPVIESNSTLRFAHHDTHTRLVANRFGIWEPDPEQANWIEPSALDCVLTPLVAFDRQCNRIGMGGGYYDQTFAFVAQAQPESSPLLVGIAHDLQRVERIEPKPWDVHLNMVVTPRNLYLRN